jgi:hypothetical protein
MNWLHKIAAEAFNNEMDNLLKNQGMHNIMDNKIINKTPKSLIKNPEGSASNVGVNDEYNPTESESEYGQSL